MAEFTPVGELAQQSQAAWDAITDSIRKRDAYNSLRKIYGPIAGDPVNALRMQAYGQNEQMNPLQLQNQQLTNQGKQQQNDYLGQSYPLQLQQQQQEVQQGDQKTQANDMSLSAQKALRARGVLSGALSALGGDDDGTPQGRETKWNTVIQRSAGLLGVDPSQLDGSLGGQKQEYLQGGPTALPNMQKELDSVTLGALSPLDRQKLQLAQAKATQGAAAADQKSVLTQAQIDNTTARTGLVTTQNDLAKAKLPGAPMLPGSKEYGKLQDSVGGLDTFNRRLAPILGGVRTQPDGTVQYNSQGMVGQALKWAQLSSPNATIRRARALIPGTPEYNLSVSIEKLKGAVSLADLTKLKESTGSIGRVLQSEYSHLGDAFGNLDPYQDMDQLVGNLRNVGGVIQDFRTKAQQQIDDGNAKLNPPSNAPAGALTAPGAATPAPGVVPAPAAPAAPGVDPTTTQTIPPQPGAPASSPAAPDAVAPEAAGAQSPAVAAPTPPTGEALRHPISAAEYFGNGVNVANLPAGMRNNNPGNIKYTSRSAFGGTVIGPSANTDQGDPQAVFSNPLAGMRAAANLALRKNIGGKATVDSLIASNGGWTPGNHAAAANIARTMGVAPTARVDLRDPAMMQKFLRGLVTQEHGPASKLYTDQLIASAVTGNGPQDARMVAAASRVNSTAAPAAAAPVQVAAAAPSAPEAAAAAGGVEGPAARTALLPPGSGDLGNGTAAAYQPQTGPAPAAPGPQGGAGPSAGAGGPPEPAGALGAPPVGPGAVTPEGQQVGWERVLPYLPELLAMAMENRRKESKRA